MADISETETEWLFKDLLEEQGYFTDEDIIIEFKDKTADENLKQLLAKASKQKNAKGRGIPDFIVRSHRYPDIVFLIECKPDTKFHASPNGDKPGEYAVDGAIHYAKFVSQQYDTVSIALSGSSQNHKVSAFWQLRGSEEPIPVGATELLPYNNYKRLILESEIAFRRDYSTLLEYAKTLNAHLHKNKIKESHRALLISGILVALQNRAFNKSFRDHETAQALITALINAISTELRADAKKGKNADTVLSAFSFIKTNQTFTNKSTGLSSLRDIIIKIQENVYMFMDKYRFVDTLSQFYVEFLRYANTDKGLGIVLTPIHITSLFAKMAGVNKNTVVLDNAAGTGGFLVAAMGEMMKDAGDDENKIQEIRENQIWGVEYDDSIFALLTSNMIIHSDGRSHMNWGDNFDVITKKKPNDSRSSKETNLILFDDKHPENNPIDVGLLNPPFKAGKDDIPEFEFIFSNLSAVKRGGTVIALVPVSVVTSTSGEDFEYKKRLLENHTLEAVVSLPEELFSNSKTSVVTVGMVIKAHTPHPKLKKTWLGYWRNDGFVKTKRYGRADVNHTWDGPDGIESKWLSAYINKEEISMFSTLQLLTAENEWLAEAYLETDYSLLDENLFEQTVREYQAFRLENNL